MSDISPFSQCCDCSSAPPPPAAVCQFTIVRLLYCFPEYEATHDTDNPITYFLGRFYRQADFSGSLSGGTNCDPCPDTITASSSLSALIGAPYGSSTDCAPGTSNGSGPMFFAQGGYAYGPAPYLACMFESLTYTLSPTSIVSTADNKTDATIFSGTSTLSVEVDYDAFCATLFPHVSAVQAFATAHASDEACLSTVGGFIFGFNDAPNPFGTLLSDYSAYDGSFDATTVNSGRLCNSTAAYGELPGGPYGYTASAWILDGTCGAPGAMIQGVAAIGVALPYVLATFFIMNDGSFVLDTGTPCVDGGSSANFWVSPPSMTGIPSGEFGTDGDGHLTGPIGRICVVVPDMTCADYDGTFPT